MFVWFVVFGKLDSARQVLHGPELDLARQVVFVWFVVFGKLDSARQVLHGTELDLTSCA